MLIALPYKIQYISLLTLYNYTVAMRGLLNFPNECYLNLVDSINLRISLTGATNE